MVLLDMKVCLHHILSAYSPLKTEHILKCNFFQISTEDISKFGWFAPLLSTMKTDVCLWILREIVLYHVKSHTIKLQLFILFEKYVWVLKDNLFRVSSFPN